MNLLFSRPCLPLCRLQRLLTLLPFLQDRMLRMQPRLLAALAADPERVAGRLIELKSLLPLADVAAIARQRPSLLLDGEWERVAGGAAQLGAVYEEAEVARIASAEPLLLVEDLQHILAELQRCECGMRSSVPVRVRV